MGKKSRNASKSSKKHSAVGRSGGAGGGSGAGNSRKKLHINLLEDEPSNENSPTSSSFQSIYQVYKTATLRVKEQLSSLVPSTVFKYDNVQCLLDAADYINENGIAIDGALLRNLRTAINVRKKYSQRLLDGGDEGHAYFLLVLNYCMQVLKQCKIDDGDLSSLCDQKGGAEKDGAEEEEDEEGEKAFFNRFSALSMEDELDVESDDDEDDDAPMARPEPPSDGKAYSIEDMMSFPEKARCMELFDTMAFHMHKLKAGLINLKKTMRMEANGEYPTCQIGNELTAMGMMAKEMMLDVERLEDELYIECPDLAECPHCVIAVCFFSPLINGMHQNVQTHSPLSSKFKRAHALRFFGDVIQAVFRCKDKDPELISLEFSKKWKLPDHWKMKVRWMASLVSRWTHINVRTDAENACFRKIEFGKDEEFMQKAPLWMSEEFMLPISGDQSVLNTMKILDMFGSSYENEGDDVFPRLVAYILNKSKWNGNNSLASKIRGELDIVLIKFLNCLPNTHWRADINTVPMENKILPIVFYMRSWMRSEMKAAKFSLVFSLHCVLVSLYELQGNDDISRIASVAKERISHFIRQTGEHLTLNVPCSKDRERCLQAIVETKTMTEVTEDFHEENASGLITSDDFDLMFYNPVCAGLFLAYTSIYLSLRGGLIANSTSNDLSFVLHLYNALKQRGLVDDDLPLISDVDNYFKKQKWVWNGWDKPGHGKFTYRMHLCLGADNELASFEQDLARYTYNGGEKPIKPNISLSKLKHTRKTSKRLSKEIHPADISDTYKLYCSADFEDIRQALENDPNAPKRLKIDPNSPFPMPFQIFEAKSYLILSAFLREATNELQYNMAAVGTVFMQFLYETFNDHFKESIEHFEARTDLPTKDKGEIRNLVNLQITREILSALDYNVVDDDFEYLGDAFEEFFRGLDMDRVLLNKYDSS